VGGVGTDVVGAGCDIGWGDGLLTG